MGAFPGLALAPDASLVEGGITGPPCATPLLAVVCFNWGDPDALLV